VKEMIDKLHIIGGEREKIIRNHNDVRTLQITSNETSNSPRKYPEIGAKSQYTNDLLEDILRHEKSENKYTDLRSLERYGNYHAGPELVKKARKVNSELERLAKEESSLFDV
jgi:hypothetical protein